MSTSHYVDVHVDEAYLERLAKYVTVTDEHRADAYTATLECSDPAACPGWLECVESHDGYDPDDEDSPAYDQTEDVEIHGITHQWTGSYGWVIDHPGCPVTDQISFDVPDGIPMDRPGRYLVMEDWDDTDCYLELVREVTTDE